MICIAPSKRDTDNANSYYDDPHEATGRFDFVLANPPFNMSDWGGENLRQYVRWKFGVPPVNNANYAWIQHLVQHSNTYARHEITT